MKTNLKALTLLLILSLAACGENHGNGSGGGDAAPSGAESTSSQSEGGDELPLPNDDDGLAEAIVNEGDNTTEETVAEPITGAAPSAEDSVTVTPPSAGRTALIGSHLQSVKNIIDQTQALAAALESESTEYFRTHESRINTRRVMAQNTGRIALNLRRASRMVTAWYEYGSEPVANTARFRSSYSRLRAHLRRALQLANITRRVGRRNEAIATFDSQLAAIVSGTTNAINELNTVVGTVRAPHPRRTSR